MKTIYDGVPQAMQNIPKSDEHKTYQKVTNTQRNGLQNFHMQLACFTLELYQKGMYQKT
jgi:hypothetical protein